MEQTTVLYSCYETALAARKALADAACGRAGAEALPWFAEAAAQGLGALGCETTTPAAWLVDAWELSGDGRRIVGAAERELLLAQLASAQPLFPLSEGAIPPLARFVGRYAGEPRFEQIVGVGDGARAVEFGLSEAEDAVFSLIAAYRERLEREGLIEEGEAAAALAPDDLGGVVVAEAFDAPAAVEELVERCATASYAEREARIAASPSQRSFFAFPAGQAAVKDALLHLVDEELADDASIALYAHDPLAAHEALVPALAAEGIGLGLQCPLPFDGTSFGRALANAEALASGSGHWVQAATDFAYGPFSGMSPIDARRLNGRLRGDRCLDAADARAMLVESSPAFGAFLSLVEGDGDFRGAIAQVSAVFEEAHATRASRAVEARAIDSYVALREMAEAHGIPAALANARAHRSRVPVSLASPEAAAAPRQVRLFGHEALGRAGAGAFDAVIVEGLTDAAFSTASSRSSFDGLAERLGLPAAPSRAESLRRAFEGARRAARDGFACAMPLRDASFEPTYPAFALDEYVSALAALRGWQDAGRDEGLFGFPRPLAGAALRIGEESLASALGRGAGAVEGALELPAAVRGRLASARLIDSIKTVAEGERRLPVLSPSAIEAYLACPYRWFATQRLRANELDEGFGAREMGLFAHRAYAVLFDALAEAGVRRLGEAEAARAAAALEEAMARALAEQAQAEPGERLAAASSQERLEVELLMEALRATLPALSQLPEGFSVSAHEHAIVVEDGVDFAGARLNGRIDRIDIDEARGRFAIIDYKGSIGGHEAGFGEDDDEDGFELPAKVQALIYARAFERQQGNLTAAAAVYADYRAKGASAFLAGSFDPVAYDALHLAGPRSAVQGSFAAFLDLVEARVAPAVAALMAGDIAPAPRDAGACRWCPVLDCGRRL